MVESAWPRLGMLSSGAFAVAPATHFDGSLAPSTRYYWLQVKIPASNRLSLISAEAAFLFSKLLTKLKSIDESRASDESNIEFMGNIYSDVMMEQGFFYISLCWTGM